MAADRTPRPTLTEGPIRGHLTRMTIPMTWAILSMMAFNLADTYFVGQLGLEQLAGITFTFPVIMVLISLAIGLGAGTSSVVARAIGEGDAGKVRRLTTDAMLLTAVAAALLGAIGWLTIDPLFRLLGAGPDVLPYIHDYMAIWYLGTVFFIAPTIGHGAIRASGSIGSISAVMIGAALLNAILDPLLIFGLWGFPRLEVEGAALATVVTRMVSLVAILAILHFRRGMLSFERLRWSEMKYSASRILHVGLPAASAHMIIPVSMAVITALIATMGTAPVAAFGVASRVDSMAMVFFFAMSAIIGPIVGQNIGARKTGRIQEALGASFAFCLVFGAILALILAWYGRDIVSVFSDSSEANLLATRYLWIVPVSYGTSGIIMVANAAFNGMGRPMPAIGITALRMVGLFIPLAFLGSWLNGAEGVFAALAVSSLIMGAVAYVWVGKVVREIAAGDEPDEDTKPDKVEAETAPVLA